MSLPWRMPCCAAPAPEPHDPDTARPHTSPTNAAHGWCGGSACKIRQIGCHPPCQFEVAMELLAMVHHHNACEKCGLVLFVGHLLLTIRQLKVRHLRIDQHPVKCERT